MLSGQRSAWRRRGGKYRAARIAVPLAIPMALGLTLGIILAVSGGNTTKIHQSAAAAAVAPGNTSSAVNPNCDIIVPAHPLSARGLATPYQLTGPAGTTPQASGCEMTNSVNLGAFVQAGATPGALRQGNCVDGLNGSAFGQVSFCNGINFFRAAFQLEREGRLFIPSTGTSAKIVPTAGAIGTGNACPTVRNFDMVDQDQSDNVTTIYLLNPTTGQTAQDTAANEASLAGAQKLVNGSDNALIDDFLDPHHRQHLVTVTPRIAQPLQHHQPRPLGPPRPVRRIRVRLAPPIRRQQIGRAH